MLNRHRPIWLFFAIVLGSLASAICFGQDISSLTVSPNPVTVGEIATGTVTLSKAAGAGGMKITLASSETTTATVPASVTVASGSTTATFAITTARVTEASKTTITGTDPKSKKASEVLTVDPPSVRLTQLEISPSAVTIPTAAAGTITLSAEAPGTGFTVKLSAAEPFISTPTAVTIQPGSRTGTFKIITLPVLTAGKATVTAEDSNGYAISKALTVDVPKIRLAGLSISPKSVSVGATATGTVTLTANAASGGFVVKLGSAQSFATVSASVTVKAGSKTATFSISAGTVSSASTATISGADAAGYSASAMLTVDPQTTSTTAISMTDQFTFSPQGVTVAAGSVIVWTNVTTDMSHTATADVSGQGPTSPVVTPGKTYSWTVPANTKSGTKFFYHCQFHGAAGNGTSLGTGMAGVIIVQ